MVVLNTVAADRAGAPGEHVLPIVAGEVVVAHIPLAHLSVANGRIEKERLRLVEPAETEHAFRSRTFERQFRQNIRSARDANRPAESRLLQASCAFHNQRGVGLMGESAYEETDTAERDQSFGRPDNLCGVHTFLFSGHRRDGGGGKVICFMRAKTSSLPPDADAGRGWSAGRGTLE